MQIAVRGSYGFAESGMAVFVLEPDADKYDELVNQLRHTYVLPMVVPTDDGGLGLKLSVPDRDLAWTIPIQKEHLDRMRAGARTWGGVGARVDGPEGKQYSLAPFTLDFDLDWSGRSGIASRALSEKRPDEAAEALGRVSQKDSTATATEHWLAGRQRMLEGDGKAAIAHYRNAVKLAVRPGGELLPFASQPLCDMGVAYKRLDDEARALRCFRWSLTLRPNHPEALATFASIDRSQEVMDQALARIWVLGRQSFAQMAARQWAEVLGRSAEESLRRAEEAAGSVDLGTWSGAVDGQLTWERFAEQLGFNEPEGSNTGANEQEQTANAASWSDARLREWIAEQLEKGRSGREFQDELEHAGLDANRIESALIDVVSAKVLREHQERTEQRAHRRPAAGAVTMVGAAVAAIFLLLLIIRACSG